MRRSPARLTTSSTKKSLARLGAAWRLGGKIVSAVLVVALVGGCREKSKTTATTSATSERTALGFEVVDETGAVAACRIHLRNAAGEALFPPGFPRFHDHFVFPGRGSFELPAGSYTYEVERGPEFTPVAGTVTLSGGPETVRLQLERLVDLAKEGWFSGDLHIHRGFEDIDLLTRAEDLRVAPVITWGNDGASPSVPQGVAALEGGRFADPTAGEDERFGGALLFFRLEKPLPLPPNARDEKNRITHRAGDVNDEWPPPAAFAESARKSAAAHVDIEKPFWWDVPTWVAGGIADSIGIAHNHMNRVGPRDHEAWGRRCPGGPGRDPLTNGYCSQDIYYRILDAGIRIAPSAGSASGVLPNPVGYNRVYVHAASPLTYDDWWKGLKAGRSFVTNGPLLLVSANGELPGHVFSASAGQPLRLSLDARVVSSTPIRSVELVRDGRAAATAKYDAASGRAEFEPQLFKESGWFLIRALTTQTDTFRFASTGPYYVEVKGTPPRISKSAAKFFLTWVDERIAQLVKADDSSPELAEVLSRHRTARTFWERRLQSATVD